MTYKCPGDTRIYISGPPFSGKSATAAKTAELLELPCYDLDLMVEETEGIGISEIFRLSGELRFREIESSHLHRLAHSSEGFILSLGGGCLLDPRNLQTVLSTGTVISLFAPVQILEERAALDPGSRPLAADPAALRTLLASRESHYAGLPKKIDTAEMTVDEAAAAVVDIIERVLQTRK